MAMLLLLTLLTMLSSCFAATSRCYFPNGEESTDFPCDPDAEDSTCCSGNLGSVCLSNKLCQTSGGNIVRAACTDQKWNSLNCPMFCVDADTGGTDLISCQNVTSKDTSYCCDHKTYCCDSGVGRFDVLPSNPQPWATWNVESSRFLVVGTMFVAKSSTTSQSTTPTTLESTTSPTGSGLASASESASTSNSSPEPSSGLSHGTQAGIGVGVGVGSLLVSAVIYLIWKLRKFERRQNNEPPCPPSEHLSPSVMARSQYYHPAAPKESQTTEFHNGLSPSEIAGQVRLELPDTSMSR